MVAGQTYPINQQNIWSSRTSSNRWHSKTILKKRATFTRDPYFKKRKRTQVFCSLSVIQLGFEPRTPTLKVLCSTCWATESWSGFNMIYWWVNKSNSCKLCHFWLAQGLFFLHSRNQTNYQWVNFIPQSSFTLRNLKTRSYYLSGNNKYLLLLYIGSSVVARLHSTIN